MRFTIFDPARSAPDHQVYGVASIITGVTKSVKRRTSDEPLARMVAEFLLKAGKCSSKDQFCDLYAQLRVKLTTRHENQFACRASNLVIALREQGQEIVIASVTIQGLGSQTTAGSDRR